MSLAPRIDKFERNLLINGIMQYWQRGTTSSVNLTAAGSTFGRITDRFGYAVIRTNNNQNYSFAQTTDVPVDASGIVIPYSYRVTSNLAHVFTGEDKMDPMYQVVEGMMLHDVGNSDTLNLRFWTKSSVVGTFPARFCISTTGTAVTHSLVQTYTITSANVWQLIELKVTLPGIAFHRGNGFGIAINLACTMGSTAAAQTTQLNQWLTGDYITTPTATAWQSTNGATMHFAGLSLVKGQSVLCLAGRDMAEELSLCQRYFEKSYQLTTAPGTQTFDGAFSYQTTGAANPIGHKNFVVTKRATPTFVMYNPNSANSVGLIWLHGSNSTTGAGLFLQHVNGFTVTAGGTFAGQPASVQWTADAEL